MSQSLTETIPKPFLACDFCGRNVQDGFLCVNVTLAKRRGIRRESYENRMPVYLPIPDLVPWEILHIRCAEKTGRTEQTADEFRINSALITSTSDLLTLIAELVRKPWIIDTDLSNLLRRVIADTIYHFDVRAEKKRKKEAQKAGELAKAV